MLMLLCDDGLCDGGLRRNVIIINFFEVTRAN